jgi:hypothetical protein
MWFRNKRSYLFVPEGVYEAPDDFSPSDFKTLPWTFVDSDEASNGVPEHLVTHGSRLFVIYATSPAKNRWSRLEKTLRSVTEVIMNPWTRAEIHIG